MTGKSSKAGSCFGIHFHYCISLKLLSERLCLLKLSDIKLTNTFSFFVPLQGKKFNFGKILFSNTTIFLRCKWLQEINLFSLLFDTVWVSKHCKALTVLVGVAANFLALRENHSSDIAGCVNSLKLPSFDLFRL